MNEVDHLATRAGSSRVCLDLHLQIWIVQVGLISIRTVPTKILSANNILSNTRDTTKISFSQVT